MLFSNSYINQETFILRFHLLVVGFVFSIFLLILRPRILRILLGWDGLGVTSYLLVIYFQRRKAANAGIVTALTNRVGDVLILIRVGVRLEAGAWNLITCSFIRDYPALGLGVGLLVVAAFTKRAQIPFSAWLPAAIAAPTPVSSLVHSSTLVTAGVYLLLRLQIWVCNLGFSQIICLFGSRTIIIAGVSALFEKDIKKIVALSTLRQLGLIICCIGINLWLIATFHLLTHAYFKAILFITVGNIIHNSSDYQDLRLIRIFYKWFPVTRGASIVANISLCGGPFIAGFYSKDLFMELSFSTSLRIWNFLMFLLGVSLTCLYTIRFMYQTFFSSSQAPSFTIVSDQWRRMPYSFRVLSPLAIIGGRAVRWALFKAPFIITMPTIFKTSVSVVILLSLLGGGLILFHYRASKKGRWRLGNIWTLPFLGPPFLVSIFMPTGSSARKLIDLRLLVRFPAFDITKSINKGAFLDSLFHSNRFINLISSLIVFALLFSLIYLCILNQIKPLKLKILYAKHLYINKMAEYKQ